MSTMTTENRSPVPTRTISDIDLATATASAPASLGDISCWRLLTARIPLTLLLDLALPGEQLDEMHDEMLAEPTSLDWLTVPVRA